LITILNEETETIETEEKPEIVEGSVIYEQDLRASTHSNGRFADLVGSSVEGPPPESPDDDSHDRRDDGKSPKTMRYLMASIYMVGGIAFLYVGITMIRDLKGEK